MSRPAAAPLALFHLGLVSELVHRQWGGPQQRRQRQQQGQMQVHQELFSGLGMAAVAASWQPVVPYAGLDKLHVLNALQAAYETAFNRSQLATVTAHVAASWGNEGLSGMDSSNQAASGIAAGLHGTVAELVLGLLGLCAPYKGCNELKVLTTGLKMLQLVLSDAALLQQTQQQSSSAGDGSSSGSATTAASGATSSTTAAASPAVAVLAAACIGPLLTDVGPLCTKGEDHHPFSAQLFPPMPWPELMAAEEGGELLPLFGGLLRDALLVMSPTDAAAALAAACQTKPVVASQTLEWVLRSCVRVEKGSLSTRSCGPGPAEGTCSTELKPAFPSPCMARAAAAAAGCPAAPAAAAGRPLASVQARAATTTAAVLDSLAGPATPPCGSLWECLTDGLDSLVLLCHRVVLGVTAAGPWTQAPSTAAGSSTAAGGSSRSGSSGTAAAAKHQLAVLNSCLKLLNRLVVQPALADDEEGEQFTAEGGFPPFRGSDYGSDCGSDFGSGSTACTSGSLSPSGRWWGCQAAAAAAAFGVSLAGATSAAAAAAGEGTSGSSSNSGSSNSGSSNIDSSNISSSSSRGKLRSAGLSLAARGLLFVSRNLQDSPTLNAEAQHSEQQNAEFVSSVTSSCRALQAALAELPPRGRSSLPQLQAQGESLLRRLTSVDQLQGHMCTVQQLFEVAEIPADLEQFCMGVAAQLPASFGCNYTECLNLWDDSEPSVATSKCGGYSRAYFCSKTCQAAYWKQHKEACRAFRPAAV